ncbi:MAG: hypothetical protein QNJ58_13185 [Desulfobacterales bacterium]|nr:hypothetical protein [Desulfobacterales bacterium]
MKFHTSAASGLKKPAGLVKKETLDFERKRGMDSYLKEKNWTGPACHARKNGLSNNYTLMAPIRKKLGNA